VEIKQSKAEQRERQKQ